ncbi:DNA topoisomerase 3 [Burkholderia vietnamiensis]|uniref:DNA topoisomerase 3 n=1 Tax=Burkholderia vietnamiensis TaxID=60552 RepID=UPI001B931706|nr:DNA topoisomerase 3 [Burkholderia vietnamiensis]MBR7920209.1 DNA topoisomerase 3 [Burkholderia vietnamiensis]MBR8205296.1 DNA topoisomerase 3 [Burkholderia vietnamiensis]HDR9133999.1 DNA topoisomerase 3 [Burkholderia vietnamiensis]
MKVYKVYIAEKKSLGIAVAEQLMKASPTIDSGNEPIIAGKDWAVCWPNGHILEQEDPDFYLAQRFPGAPKTITGKIRWTFDHIPLVPEKWALKVVPDKARLFKTIEQLVAKASVIYNVGDPDFEGQLLIDEILEELRYAGPVKRVLISAYDEHSVRTGLQNERDNAEYRGWRDAALARSRADWLCGMNYTRAATLSSQAAGYAGGVVTIGRVQTTVLGLIVARDLEIENFKPVDYFALTANMQVAAGRFAARWIPHEGQAGLDPEGRLLDQGLANALNAHVSGKVGKVIDYADEDLREGPPLPFSLDKLQILAGKKYGYKPDEVLEAAQNLYEKHKLTTYPRTDCQFLPLGQLGDAAMVLQAASTNMRLEQKIEQHIDHTRKSRAWNDGKVTAHHAIIPTSQTANLSHLSTIERHIYDEVAKRYVAQFLPDRQYRRVTAKVDVAGQHFGASGSTTTFVGWKMIDGAVDDESAGDAKDQDSLLPVMSQGEAATCLGLVIEKKKTKAPDPFTDSSLLDAMTNIHKFVSNEQIRALLKEAQGIGTPATRDSFVPKLVTTGMLIREESPGAKGGKKAKEANLRSTPTGRALIKGIPAELAVPDMTALWESAMQQIAAGKASVDKFLAMQSDWIGKTVSLFRTTPLSLPDPPGVKKRPAGSGPRTPAKMAGQDCPMCGAPMVERMGGKFLGCSSYPKCKHTINVAAAA